MELQQATRIVAVLCAAYRVNDPATASVYIDFLQDLDVEFAERAVKVLITEEAEWMPSVKAIRDRHDLLLADWTRSQKETLQLPPIEYTEEDEAQIKEILGQYWGQPGRDKTRWELASAVARGDQEAKLELARKRARELSELGEPERPTAPTPGSGNNKALKMCDCVGKPVVIKGGEPWCPRLCMKLEPL